MDEDTRLNAVSDIVDKRIVNQEQLIKEIGILSGDMRRQIRDGEGLEEYSDRLNEYEQKLDALKTEVAAYDSSELDFYRAKQVVDTGLNARDDLLKTADIDQRVEDRYLAAPPLSNDPFASVANVKGVFNEVATGFRDIESNLESGKKPTESPSTQSLSTAPGL